VSKTRSSASADPAASGSTGFSEGWDVYQIALSEDPHARWRALRERAPIHDVGGGVFLVTSFELCERALKHPELESGRGVAESFGATGYLREVIESWLMSQDGPAHDRARGLVSRVFTARRVAELREFARAEAQRLIEAAFAHGPAGRAELARGLGFALPSQVIRHLFRIRREDWAREVESHFGVGEPLPLLALAEVFRERLRAGAGDPEGLFAQLSAEDPALGRLSELEIVANAVLLVSAAIDTTAGLISNAILCLLQEPGAWARVGHARARLSEAVLETLRYEPSALSASRSVPRPLKLGDVEVPAGAQLLICIAAAQRDPARFREPDRFDLERGDRELLVFGGGRHFCLGAALARMEAEVALGALLDAAPELSLASPVEWRKDNPTIRAPRELWVQRALPSGGAPR
jgi:cytochrome P450